MRELTEQRNYQVSPERRQEVAGFVQERLGLNSLEIIESGHDIDFGQTPDSGFQARSYQLDAWGRLWDHRQAGQDRRLLHMATGLGKTTVAGIDMLKFQEECARQKPSLTPRMLYVSHKREINEQAAESLQGLAPDLDLAILDGRNRRLPDVDVTFGTFQLLRNRLDRIDPQSFEYIVWDEGHHIEADTYRQVVDHFTPLDEMAITATPDRADGRDIRTYFGKAVYSKGLAEAMAEGWLSSVDYRVLLDQSVKDKLTAKGAPITATRVKKILAGAKLPPDILAQDIRNEIAEMGLDNPKTIVFAQTIDRADMLAERLKGAAYHGNVHLAKRREILEDFRAGRLQTIVTRDMFNEGVDIPDAELIVFDRSTQSRTVFEQQLGRGLRRAPGKKKVYVLDYAGTIDRITMLRDLSQQIRRHPSRRKKVQADRTKHSSLTVYDEVPNGFTFDKVAEDVVKRLQPVSREEYLERARMLMEQKALAPHSVPEQPTIMSIGDFCRSTGIRQATLLRVIRRNGIPMERIPGGTGVGFNERAQQMLMEHFKIQ